MTVVVWISADPRSSGKAAEGLREALGFAGSGFQVTAVLGALAEPFLTGDPEEFVGGEAARSYVEPFGRFGGRFVRVRETGLAELCALVQSCDRFLRFRVGGVVAPGGLRGAERDGVMHVVRSPDDSEAEAVISLPLSQVSVPALGASVLRIW